MKNKGNLKFSLFSIISLNFDIFLRFSYYCLFWIMYLTAICCCSSLDTAAGLYPAVPHSFQIVHDCHLLLYILDHPLVRTLFNHSSIKKSQSYVVPYRKRTSRWRSKWCWPWLKSRSIRRWWAWSALQGIMKAPSDVDDACVVQITMLSPVLR